MKADVCFKSAEIVLMPRYVNEWMMIVLCKPTYLKKYPFFTVHKWFKIYYALLGRSESIKRVIVSREKI